MFNHYIDVVNRVISGNRDRLYGRLTKLWERLFGDAMVAVGVYRRDAANPDHWYTIMLSGGRVDVLDDTKIPSAKFKVKIKQTHLENVVENPERYVERPFQLDLDWFKTRIGLC